MHSLKNTIIAVGLLGLSFGFYQMSAPDQSSFEEIDPPVVTDRLAELGEATSDGKLQFPSLESPHAEGNGSGFSSSLLSHKPPAFNLPSPKISNPLAAPAMPEPKLTPPAPLTQPGGSFVNEQPEFQPRPEAKFDFTGKSGPTLTSPVGVQQRDQGLITALKKQQQTADGSQSKATDGFQVNTFVPQMNQPVQSKLRAQPASFMRDSSVVTVSNDSMDAANKFELQPANTTGSDSYADLNFKTVWPVAETLVAEKRFRKCLELLTRFYDSPGLSGPQRQLLGGWLDGLASKVVFSSEHHLHPAYVSEPGDSLLELGRKWGVPGQLIYGVNKESLPNPMVIPPGTELKKISGPINASIDLSSNTMTLFVDGLYAGRFNVIVGTSGSPRAGDFRVGPKMAGGYEWKDASGAYPPGHPNNHYGQNWIGLEGSLCIHAVAADVTAGHRGCLGLSEKDSADLFSILSEGSTISIR